MGFIPQPYEVNMEQKCDHHDGMRYARRTFSNGSIAYCIQCKHCGAVVKHSRHNFRPFIKHSEIPTGYQIHEFNDRTDDSWQGALFNE